MGGRARLRPGAGHAVTRDGSSQDRKPEPLRECTCVHRLGSFLSGKLEGLQQCGGLAHNSVGKDVMADEKAVFSGV